MVLWLSDNIIIEEKMIANALICMAEYDNRGIVDWDDIHHFQNAFSALCHEKGCSFEVLQLCDDVKRNMYMFSDYILPVAQDGLENYQNSFAYILLPWIEIDDLKSACRNQFPIDAMFTFFDKDIYPILPSREAESLEQLARCFRLGLNNLEKSVDKDLSEVQKKVYTLDQRKSMIQQSLKQSFTDDRF